MSIERSRRLTEFSRRIITTPYLERREYLLSLVLGALAGPIYLLFGPENFYIAYLIVLGGGCFSTAHWLKELEIEQLKVLMIWPLVMSIGIAFSMGLSLVLKSIIVSIM